MSSLALPPNFFQLHPLPQSQAPFCPTSAFFSGLPSPEAKSLTGRPTNTVILALKGKADILGGTPHATQSGGQTPSPPHCPQVGFHSTPIALVQVTNQLHVVEADGHFSVFMTLTHDLLLTSDTVPYCFSSSYLSHLRSTCSAESLSFAQLLKGWGGPRLMPQTAALLWLLFLLK